jgi:hypothetical protein
VQHGYSPEHPARSGRAGPATPLNPNPKAGCIFGCILFGSFVAFLAFLSALGFEVEPRDNSTAMASPVPTPAASASAAPTRPQPTCASTLPEKDAAIRDEALVRVRPGKNEPPVIKPGTSPSAKDAVTLATMDDSVSLREQCRVNGWARVRVVANTLRWIEGWVPVASLRPLRLTADGKRVLTTGDIEWQPGSERDKAAILAVANKIIRQDKRCDAIDGRSLLVEGSPGARRYMLLCDSAADEVAIQFSARDATNGRSFAHEAEDETSVAAEPIAKRDAINACQSAIEAQLFQPRSANFRTIMDTTFTTDGSRARVTIGFSAKNRFGAELDQVAACVFDGTELQSAEILPS